MGSTSSSKSQLGQTLENYPWDLISVELRCENFKPEHTSANYLVPKSHALLTAVDLSMENIYMLGKIFQEPYT